MAEEKQASFVVGKTCKKSICEGQTRNLPFAVTIKINSTDGTVQVFGVQYQDSKKFSFYFSRLVLKHELFTKEKHIF